MKQLILLLFVILVSCNSNTPTIAGKTLLKDLSEQVFNGNLEKTSSFAIHAGDSIFNYTPTYRRLPNNEFSKFYIKKHPDTFIPYFNVTVNFKHDHTITMEGTEYFKEEIVPALEEFTDFAREGKNVLIHLNFDERLTFSDFLKYEKLMQATKNKHTSFNSEIYIYNLDALPDCDCSL